MGRYMYILVKVSSILKLFTFMALRAVINFGVTSSHDLHTPNKLVTLWMNDVNKWKFSCIIAELCQAEPYTRIGKKRKPMGSFSHGLWYCSWACIHMTMVAEFPIWRPCSS